MRVGDDMARQCSQCNHKEHSFNSYSCSICGSDLVDNGQLVDALTLWGKEDTPVLKYAIPLGLVAASGALSAAFDTHLILYFGIAASAIYYLKSNK